MRRYWWISIRRLKAHEFNRTLRLIKQAGSSWLEVRESLDRSQKNSAKGATKLFSSALVLCAILNSFGTPDNVSLTIQNFTTLVPSGLVTLSASTALLFFTLQLQNTLMIMSIRATDGARIRYHGFSVDAYDEYHKGEGFGLSIPVLYPGFLKPKIPIPNIILFFICAVFLFGLIPLCALAYFLAAFQMDILQNAAFDLINWFPALCGLITVAIAIGYLVLFNLPIPMMKSRTQIRFGFLYRISRTFPHPRADLWLKDPK